MTESRAYLPGDGVGKRGGSRGVSKDDQGSQGNFEADGYVYCIDCKGDVTGIHKTLSRGLLNMCG